MEKHIINFEFQSFDFEDDLKDIQRQLLDKAKEAAQNAYAPYSGFHVGAAIQLTNGQVITGNNQENAAYPSGLCAERVAIFSAGALFPGIEISSIAVTAMKKGLAINTPIPPCGACRQAMLEYENRQKKPIEIILGGEKGKVFIIPSVSSLLPIQFDAQNL